ncbi:MAG: hypothetical protein ACKPH7_13165, partial [Planktothrix sp.]|uniref:hypothetical protein n=1 Tax=Planktothrix sp. TaxID=3088171 RepID=UPI0038D4750B
FFPILDYVSRHGKCRYELIQLSFSGWVSPGRGGVFPPSYQELITMGNRKEYGLVYKAQFPLSCYSKSKSVVITSMTQTFTVGAIHELPLPQIK